MAQFEVGGGALKGSPDKRRSFGEMLRNPISRRQTMSTDGVSDQSPVRLGVFSWNVGNAQPGPGGVAAWLPAGGAGMELLAVGTQENKFKKSKKKGELHEAADGEDEDGDEAPAEATSNAEGALARLSYGVGYWERLILSRLGSEWVILRHVSLRQMFLTLFVRASHRALVKSASVRSAKSATGLGGVVGNKGGLAISLTFGSTSLAFVSCHLAAHDHKNKERNEMCREILAETASAIGDQRKSHRGKLDVATQFDHCFWFGDLNYRVDLRLGADGSASDGAELAEPSGPPLDHQMHHAAVRALVERRDWAALMRADQLRHSAGRGEAFAGFVEGQYDFAPTFKVLRKRGTRYKDQRIPSYCDRVLWRSMPARADAVLQTGLSSVADVETSDHKPVFSTFQIAPSPPVDTAAALRQPACAASVRVRGLRLSGIIPADINGRSDPYLQFFTNPPSLLGGAIPTSTVKKSVVATGTLATGEYSSALRLGLRAKVSAADDVDGISWDDAEVPLLQLACPVDQLANVTLILAVFDWDRASRDDSLGAVCVSLGRPTTDSGQGGYELHVDQPIVWKNSTRGTGRLACTLCVGVGHTERDAGPQRSSSRLSPALSLVRFASELRLSVLRLPFQQKPLSPPGPMLVFGSIVARKDEARPDEVEGGESALGGGMLGSGSGTASFLSIRSGRPGGRVRIGLTTRNLPQKFAHLAEPEENSRWPLAETPTLKSPSSR